MTMQPTLRLREIAEDALGVASLVILFVASLAAPSLF